MSAAQLAAFQADVEANYSSVVSATINAIGGFTGEVQYSNAGVERSETGDCSTCECAWCYDIDLTADNFTMSAIAIPPWGMAAIWTSGTGWVAATELNRGIPNEYFTAFGTDRLMPDSTYTKIEITFSVAFGNQSFGASNLNITLGATTLFAFGNTDASGTFTWTGTKTTSSDHLTLGGASTGLGYNNPAGGSGTWSHLHLEGIGANPFGGNNC